MGAEAKVLGREDILSAPAPRKHRVEVPGLGGAVYVREMTAGDKDAWEDSLLRRRAAEKTGAAALSNFRAELLAMLIVGEDDAPLFTPDDIAALAQKSARALEPAFDTALAVNALTEAAAEELAKNSGAAPGGNSSSSSRSN